MYAVRTKDLPQWANMYLWFVGHPLYQLQSLIDFGWLESICEKLRGRLPGGDVQRGDSIQEVLENWTPPFRYALDGSGLSFPQRMLRRIAEGRNYGIRRALMTFSEEECIPYRRGHTTMHWGSSSRQFLSFEEGEQFVSIGESRGKVSSGWVWVSRLAMCASVGWVSGLQLGDVTGNVFSDDMPETVYEPQQTQSEYIPVHVTVQEFGRMAPDGTDLTQYNALVVCYSDGSVDDRKGFAAAASCIFPRDTREWIPMGVSWRMYTNGAATSELVGVCLNLDVLMGRLEDFHAAVLYSDSANVVAYIGDHFRMGTEPASMQGEKLIPLIRYARKKMSQLRVAQKTVFLKHLPRKYNPADHIARRTMQSRRDVSWQGVEWNPHRITSQPELVEALLAVQEYTRQIDRGVSHLR
jgi:hypothetical protein